MAVEQARGCGFRKVGGLYLCADGPGMDCCKLPIIFKTCPTCGSGVKQTRGFQWIDPRPWVKPGNCTSELSEFCALAHPERLGDRVGLLWIGAEFYPTPGDFTWEALQMGVSRRLRGVPRGFEAGKTWVWLAHPRIQKDGEEWLGGVFQAIRPDRLEKIVTDIEACDADEMAKLAAAGITPVIVPHDDPDHRGKDAEPAEQPMLH